MYTTYSVNLQPRHKIGEHYIRTTFQPVIKGFCINREFLSEFAQKN